jgi:type I restriction enzyme S subunit
VTSVQEPLPHGKSGAKLERPLREYVSLQRGTTYQSALLDQPGPVLLGLASISRNGGFRTDSLRSYGGDSPAKLILKPGDIYVSLKDVTQSGDLLGAVARVPSTVPAGRLTQDTVKLVFLGTDVPTEYIYWLLRTPGYREYCRARAIGTTNLSLSRDDFLAFTVPNPSPERLVLVRLLEAIETKIDLNRRMNQTLEGMAQAVFRSWLVEFAPVRAKADGRQPDGMSAETAAHFPSGFVQTPHGELPAGWSWLPLDQVACFLNGLALQKFPPVDGESLPVIKIAQLRRGSTDDADQASAGIPPEYVVQDGDVLFSWSGSLLVSIWAGGLGALNQHLFKVTSDVYPKWFYLFWCKEHLPEFQRIAQAKATTMGHIQRHHLTQALVAVPPQELIKAASPFFEPLLARWLANALESRTLLKLRDILLPKLLSGEILLRDADAQLAASG